MKFSFEKKPDHKPTEEKAPEPELTQEQFDEQISQEATKLGVSLQQLQATINSFGGPEEFKRKFEENDCFFYATFDWKIGRNDQKNGQRN